MLAITESAAEAIQAIVVSSEEVPEEGGLRIVARPEGEQEKLELMIAAIAAEDDEVVEEHGAHVFLDPGAASYLEDMVLDARVEGQQAGSLRAIGAGVARLSPSCVRPGPVVRAPPNEPVA